MKNDLTYIEDIKEAIAKILRYTEGITREEFEVSEMMQDAVIRNFEIIGEATKKLSQGFTSLYVKIPWKEMSGMRDKLIQDYMGVEIDVVWKTIEDDIPELSRLFQDIETNA